MSDILAEIRHAFDGDSTPRKNDVLCLALVEIERLRTGIKRLSDEEELCAETTGDDPFSLVYLAAKLAKAESDAARLTLLFDAAKDVLSSASDTYRKRNGHLASFEDDSGEKCWIVPFDAFEILRSAVDAITTIDGPTSRRGAP